MRVVCLLVVFATIGPALAAPGQGGHESSGQRIEWRAWGDTAFAGARAQDKPVYLYLEAVWCHWCHVMQRRTLSDPRVAAFVNANFIPVRVDHDAHPALANRYRAWGWPAQIWFSPQGEELVKRSGYMPPQDFLALLDRIVAAPEALQSEPAAVIAAEPGSAVLAAQLHAELKRRHRSSYDEALGGLGLMKKFLDPDSVEYSMLQARLGDEAAAMRVRRTLDAALKLIDPVWGGVYQYSSHGDWEHPHYEKLMRSQARYLRIYSLAWLLFDDPAYRAGAFAVRDYLAEFLSSPQGAFYVSQNADLISGKKAHDYFALDDAHRRARGMPAIDTHLYASTNGQAIEGLAMLYGATGDPEALAMARKAAAWVLAHRSLGEGGFSHGTAADAGPYMADNLAMARAFLELHRATAERVWLKRARATADFIIANFRRAQAGFNGGVAAAGPLRPVPDIDENISATRFFNLLYHYTGEAAYRAAAKHGMRYLAAPAVATERMLESGILLAARELAVPPVHVTVVGGRDVPAARGLYRAALATPGWYKRIEWWDPDKGPLAHSDVQYPDLGLPAGFYCAQRRCSLPQFSAAELRALVRARRDRG